MDQQRSSVLDKKIRHQPLNSKISKTNSRPIPRIGRLIPQKAWAYPEITALHQPYLASSLELIRPAGTLSSRIFFRQVTRLCMSPSKLEIRRPVNTWTFFIGHGEEIMASGKVEAFKRPFGTNEQHCTATGYRLRCSVTSVSTKDPPTAEEFWTTSVNCWPSFLYVKVNSHLLEFRRKLDHGKDIPVDISDYVHEGRNTVKAYINLQRGASIKSEYFVFVEEIEIVKLEHAQEQVLSRRLSSESTLANIKQLLDSDRPKSRNDYKDYHSGIYLDDDDDDRDLVIIGSNSTTINLLDPILSSRIYDIPVRGRYCIHRECFDLDTFFRSRPSQNRQCYCRYHHDDYTAGHQVYCSGCRNLDDSGKDCAKGIIISISTADNWKCPLCKRDARPKSLVVDEFLLNVRAQLARSNSLDARAIRIDADGNWDVLKNRNSPKRGVENITILDDDEGNDDEDSLPLKKGLRRQRGKLCHATKKVSEKVVIDLSD